MAFRVDIGTLGKVETTPQGGMRVPAYLTRTGVFDYHTDDGQLIREYRPPEEVFNADALATLKDAPTTNDHPSEHVTPSNFKKHSIGHVTGEAKQDGDKVSASLVIQDAAAIAAIKRGRREVSCGYHCDVDDVPGIAPDGTPYDRVQRNIKYNHVAIVDDGRAGSSVRLRLDSKGNQIAQEEDPMEFERIDGVKYEVDSEPHKAAVSRRDAAEKKHREEVATLKARADGATESLAKAQESLTRAYSQERFDKAVAIRGAIVNRATAILGKQFKADGLTNMQIKAAVVAKVFPNLRIDSLGARIKDAGEQRAYVNGLFRAAVSTPVQGRNDAANAPRLGVPAHLQAPPPGVRADGGTASLSMEQRRQKRNDELEARHRQPLAMSKSNPMKAVDGFPALQGSMLETMK